MRAAILACFLMTSACITITPCRCAGDDKQDKKSVPLPPANGSTVQTTTQTKEMR